MPVSQQEKLYGLPGPQNSAVLMDMISKLKLDLQQSRAENHKLVDQLNVLISLVKRAWSGEQGATMHLANIIGMEAPNYSVQDINRNTPMLEKTRAVKNWERFAIKLLEHDYAKIQEEIRQRQQMHLQNRQRYMKDVLNDHKQEMSRFQLHKKTSNNVEDVDKQFLKYYQEKAKDDRRRVQSAYRPKSNYRAQMSRAASMAEKADVKVEDLLGQQMPHGANHAFVDSNANAAFNGLYKMQSEDDRRYYQPREHFDDASRYKQSNLFDPDVIFSPEMMAPPRDIKSRPVSATESRTATYANIRSRPKSAHIGTAFITETRPERPLKFETTRPISGNKRGIVRSNIAQRGRIRSAPARRLAPTTVKKKELHIRSNTDENDNNFDNDDNYEPELQNLDPGNHDNYSPRENYHGNNFTSDKHNENDIVEEKPPIKVKVKKGHEMDQFVEDLKLMTEMEQDFKKSTLQLQKKLGLETGGIVY
ncbi:hypothetical protein ACF0H5_005948 [Mactra antiquata]